MRMSQGDHDDAAAATPRRGYHSPMRQRQVEETRQRILAAARALFSHRGYAGTTVEAIAEGAQVSPKTVVAAFGSKREILAEVVNPVTLGGPYQEMVERLRAEPVPERRLALVANLTRRTYEEVATELELLRGAGAIAPELADIAQRVDQRRRDRQERLISFLQERGVLRGGLSPAEAADALWALTSFDLYRLLVLRRGWRPEQYETWLTTALLSQLFAPR
jgi:AcrR family transcriptional regulator